MQIASSKATAVGSLVLAFAAIGVLSLVPGEMRPHTGLPGQAEHFFAYGLASATLCGLSRTWPTRGIVAGALCLYAGVLETLQIWIPGRHAQFIDFTASASGAICGFLFVALIILCWRGGQSQSP